MGKTIGVYIHIRDEVVKKIVEEIVESFKNNVMKGLKEEEFRGFDLDIKNSADGADLIITDGVRDFKSSKGIFIVFHPRRVRKVELEFVSSHEVVGIVSKEHFKSEYEEKGKFERALKTAIRRIAMSGETDEGKFKKEATWKFIPPYGDDAEFLEASLFLDPAMRELKRKIRRIVEEVKREWLGNGGLFEKARRLRESVLKTVSDKFDWGEIRDRFESLAEDIERLKPKIATFPSLLLLGPTGSGKSFIAEIINKEVFEGTELRKVSLNTVSKDIVGSILFGSKEGSYTGAIDNPGEILSNAGRALFLDEIGEIPPDDQAKLLVYMDTLMVSPLGANLQIPAPVFIIAATNRDIVKEMERGNFRRDLYYRFRWKIRVPPLSERKEDMRFLISFVLSTRLKRRGEDPKNFYISYEAIEKLEKRDYPGNFRELEDVIERAIDNMFEDDRNVILARDIE